MGPQTTYPDQPAIGYAGTLDYKRPYSHLTMQNAEASASIPFGKGVKRKGSATTDFQATFPSAQADKVLGIVERRATYARTWTDDSGVVNGQLDGTGLIVGTMMMVVTMGRMLVQVPTGCTAGQGAHIRCTANSGSETLGAIENAADGTETIDCTTQAKFQSSCSANGLAWLEFDFTNI